MKTRRAKVVHEVCGRPLAYYPAKRALEAEADPVAVVVGYQAEEVEAALRAHLPDAPLRFALQKEQLGTAHAVLSARQALRGFDGQVLILSGDAPLVTADTLRSVMAKRGRAALAFGTMLLENPTGYGRVVHAPHGGPTLVVEEKDATPEERTIKEVNCGLYCADAAFLWKTLSRVGTKNAQREFYLTDLVALAAEGPGAVAARVTPLEATGVNDQEELSLAARAMTRHIAQAFMKSGVTIEDPERFDCDDGVEVGPDTIIEPSVRLRGRTRIGAGVNVGCGTVTCNYDGEKKHPTAIGDGAFIGSDGILVAPITIGAGAYVAAGSTLTEDVPPGALALGRSRQVNKEGWAAARKAGKPAQQTQADGVRSRSGEQGKGRRKSSRSDRAPSVA